MTELMVAVSIMSVIVIGLYSMFAHTQKALRANVSQVDILESGRSAMELIGRELEGLTACDLVNRMNVSVWRASDSPTAKPVQPLVQTDTDEKTELRRNLLHNLAFLTSFTNSWNVIVYRVEEPALEERTLATDRVGTLYRYSFSTIPTNRFPGPWKTQDPIQSLERVWDRVPFLETTGNRDRVLDGVVHFRLTPYDHLGQKIVYSFAFANYATNTVLPPPGSPAAQNATEFAFLNNALPSYVELELGILDPETFKQYQSLRGTPLAAEYLRKRANKVHLFRQRVPIRTAAP